MKKFALIVAAGSGSRMQSTVPKQFIELNGKPVLMHTMEAFYNSDPDFHFILVLPEKLTEPWKLLCEKYGFTINHILVKGGATRFHSVKNGLEKINEDGIVFIHDGVRPLVSQKTIENCYIVAAKQGNALPVIAPSESVREVFNGKNTAVDRSKYFLVQTPQTFRISLIKSAYNNKYSLTLTDDASVLEQNGHRINLVEGNRENIKITYPEDRLIAETFLKNRLIKNRKNLGF
jgi:2-C-methyl-D-erythritol 4-phosphate cytidylyltransferase